MHLVLRFAFFVHPGVVQGMLLSSSSDIVFVSFSRLPFLCRDNSTRSGCVRCPRTNFLGMCFLSHAWVAWLHGTGVVLRKTRCAKLLRRNTSLVRYAGPLALSFAATAYCWSILIDRSGEFCAGFASIEFISRAR